MMVVVAAVFLVLAYLETRRRSDIPRSPRKQRELEKLRKDRQELLKQRRKNKNPSGE